MAKFSMQAPQINTEELNDKEAIRRVQSYLYQLNEQLRYMMMNLDGENIQEGSIGETQLSRPIRQNILNIENNIGEQKQKIRALVSEDGRLATVIEESEERIMAQVSAFDEQKMDQSEFLMYADSIGFSVTGIDLTDATSETPIQGSYFTIKKNGINIQSDGALTVNTTNFKLDQYGNASFGGALISPSGYIGGLNISNNALSTYDDSLIITANTQNIGGGSAVVLRQNAGRSGLIFSTDTFTGMTIIKNLYLWDPNAQGPSGQTGNWVDVTSAILALL